MLLVACAGQETRTSRPQKDLSRTVIYDNGDQYTGDRVDGKRHGQGVYRWADGTVYTGHFREDMAEGEGVMEYSDGRKYVGQFRNDQKNGQGTYTWPGGESYTGAYTNDQRHGQGTYTWADGRNYSGSFEESRIQGKGVLTWPDGLKQEGTWMADQPIGDGVLTWPDRSTFKGVFKSSSAQTTGVYTAANGVQYHGNLTSVTRKGLEHPAFDTHKARSMAMEAEKARLRKMNLGGFHALVIGINDYKALPKLKSAQNDAVAVGNMLREKYGFSTRLLLNATRENIIEALADCRQNLTDKDHLLIYYAGHGWMDNEADEGYWLPVDATRENEANWVPNNTINTYLRAIQARHVLVVSDSCYSGKLVRGLAIQRVTPDYLFRICQKKARMVMTSGGLEPVMDAGGKNDHSVFAAAFINILQENEGIIDGATMFSRLRQPVMVNSDQTPEYSDIRKAGHDGGDFVFVPAALRKP